MELGKHLGKGLWGLADKALPVVYGIGYVLLVIRVLPEREFGNFVLVQEIFLVVTGLATAFALQPVLKYASEESADLKGIVGTGMLLHLGFTVLCAGGVVLLAGPLSATLNSSSLEPLLLYLPAMLLASFFRNFTLALLQARFLIREVFWVDAAHFLGAPILIEVFSRMHRFSTALDLITINIISLSLSSVIGLYLSRALFRMTLRPGRIELVRMWRFGAYSFGGSLSYLVYSKADTFILSAVTGPIQVAVYNSVKVFVRIYEMVTQIVQMFVLPAVSKLSSQGNTSSLKALVEKAILFATVGMIPVFLLFLVLPSPLIHILYGGRYTEAVPILQVFAFLSFVVPLISVGTNALMGLGEARLGFILGIEMLIFSVLAYAVFIPWLGAIGAAAGFLVASMIMALVTWQALGRHVPMTMIGVAGRTNDIWQFARTRIWRR